MPELSLIKTATGVMLPAMEEDAQIIQKMRVGQVIRLPFTKVRNPRFHRKFFAMLRIGFDAWEPPEKEFRGMPVQKNFDRFWKDCVIAAGFYSLVSNLKGEVRAEAQKINFGAMDDTEFERVYSAVADVILGILGNYTRDDLDRVVEQIIGFV